MFFKRALKQHKNKRSVYPAYVKHIHMNYVERESSPRPYNYSYNEINVMNTNVFLVTICISVRWIERIFFLKVCFYHFISDIVSTIIVLCRLILSLKSLVFYFNNFLNWGCN